MTCTPAGRPGGSSSLPVVVEWEAQDGLPTEQKVVRWACALVSNQIDEQYKQRALAIAYAVAATPDIVEAMNDPEPSKAIQPKSGT